MWDTIKSEWQAKGAIILYLLLILWWIFDPIILGKGHERMLGDFASIYFLMAVWGSIWGVAMSRKWGGFKSVMGKAILMFSLGLFAQAFGECVYAYYSFYLNVEIPYPSLGDLGYFGSIPLYIYGTFLLAKASGTSIKLKSLEHKLQAIIIPLVMLAIGYALFLRGYKFDWSDPVKVFLDFGYPLTQAIYISVALLTYLLSKGVLGGIMKSKVLFILFALFVQFLSDYNFLYQVSHGTWVTGGFGNFLYLSAFFLMSLALLQLVTVFEKVGPIFPSRTLKTVSGSVDPYSVIAIRIVKGQEEMIGPAALSLAKNVSGLEVADNGEVKITGNPNEVLESLVSQYANIYGQTSVEVCKEAVKKSEVQVPKQDLPPVLQ